MGLTSWVATKLGYEKRASVARPVDIWPDSGVTFGTGLSRQPTPATLLGESQGIPDTATRAIANRIASLCLEVYIEKRVSSGTTEDEVLDDHPLKALLDKPHPNLSRAQLLRLTGQYIVTVGEAYWVKVGNRFGIPTELHPVPPGMVSPLVRRNVVIGYEVIDGNGKREVYPSNVFCRFYFPDPEDPWKAKGYLGPSGIAADTHKFAGQHLRRHFQHDATPKTVLKALETAEAWDEPSKQRFWALWRERYGNRRGSQTGLPAILPTGYDLVEMAMQSGADVTPLLEYLRDDLLMGYAVPRSVLGQVVSGDRSSAETNQWVFDRYAVSPVASLISDGLTMQLAPEFDATLKVRFEPFVSEDKDHELKREQQDLQLKVRSINQIRVDRGLDEVSWGEEPVGTKADVPYDPEDARERANKPPEPPGGKSPKLGPDGEPMDPQPDEDEDDERAEQQAHIRVRQEYRARRRRRRAA